MKRISLLLLIFLFLYSLRAQDKIVDPRAPVIEFENTVHNFGEIEQGSEAMCIFSFSNVGKDPLVISNVRSSCGCTVPSWPKEPIKRKKDGTIAVKYDTRVVKTFTKSITVYSNAKNSPTRLTVTGVVVSQKQSAKSKAKIKKINVSRPSK